MRKRKDSFLGIHFDFHAQQGQIVGEDFRPNVVAELLDRVRPDYVQCDTKGHYGYSSYPTQIGTPPTELRHDVLKMWRELTRQRDIALYAHHSGLFDMAAAKAHPDWAVVDENGTQSDFAMSAFGPYADHYLIPQLIELATKYDLDGAWIDGECWAAYVDYSPYAITAYQQQHHRLPPRPEDADFECYKDFCRQGFENYVSHYVQAIKQIKPDFSITSNWIYSSQMPDKQSVKMDFLSGDLAPQNAVESARHEARCLAARNRPWDLMAWGQSSIPSSYEAVNRSTKEYEQYCQEAAVVIALGGGFEFFNIMYGNGGMVQPWAIPTWEKVAQFCRSREFCHKATPIKQIGVVYPMERTEQKQRLYTKYLDSYRGLCSWNNALLESGFSTEVVFQTEMEHLQEYPVVVLPYAPMLQGDVQTFCQYVKNGGKLIVDSGSAHYFEALTGWHSLETQERLLFLDGGDAVAAVECPHTTFTGDSTVTAQAYLNNYFSNETIPIAHIKQIGKGNITFLAIPFAKVYENNVTTAIKMCLKNIVFATGFEPLVTLSGSSYADVVLTEKEGKLLINILNTAGPSGLSKVRSYNEVPKIGPLTIRIRKSNIDKIIALPGGTAIPFRHVGDDIECTLESVHIHTALEITLRT